MSERLQDKDRTRMLTVGKLIDYLKTCNPNACVLAYEMNSSAYIHQSPKLPGMLFRTVAEDKEVMLGNLKRMYRRVEDAERKISEIMEETYRYAEDDDVVVNG